jgi:hypothetical protein
MWAPWFARTTNAKSSGLKSADGASRPPGPTKTNPPLTPGDLFCRFCLRASSNYRIEHPVPFAAKTGPWHNQSRRRCFLQRFSSKKYVRANGAGLAPPRKNCQLIYRSHAKNQKTDTNSNVVVVGPADYKIVIKNKINAGQIHKGEDAEADRREDGEFLLSASPGGCGQQRLIHNS